MAWIAAICLGLWAGLGVVPLDEAAVAQLFVMEDRIVPGLVVDQVAAFGPGLVVGGRTAVKGEPIILVVDVPGSPVASLARAACPYFAISPDGRRVVYWRRVEASGTGQPVAELVVVEISTGKAEVVSAPLTLPRGGRLLWPLPSNIVYAVPRQIAHGVWAVVWRHDIGVQQSFAILRLNAAMPAGELSPAEDAGHVIFRAGGVAWKVPLTGARAERLDFMPFLQRPGAEQWLALRPRVELRSKAGEALAHLPFAASCAAWAPTGEAVALASKGKLWVAPASLEFARQLCGWAGGAEEFTAVLWRDTVVDMACGAMAPEPALHMAALGLRRIELTVLFPANVPVRQGQRMWIAGKFVRDKQGRILKPDWPTVKACFQVLGAEPAAGGIAVRAVNVGAQAGVLERICEKAGLPENARQVAGSAGGRRVVWVRRYSLKPREDLRAWVNTSRKWLGELRAVEVEERRLDAP